MARLALEQGDKTTARLAEAVGLECSVDQSCFLAAYGFARGCWFPLGPGAGSGQRWAGALDQGGDACTGFEYLTPAAFDGKGGHRPWAD
jgi:hypothetical protein